MPRQKKHSCHRDDERLNLQVSDQKSLSRAEYNTEKKHKQAHWHSADSCSHADCKQHAVQGNQRADRNVDSGSQHHDGKSAGNANQSGIRNQDIQECLQMDKTF
jgi:hypothetical protein